MIKQVFEQESSEAEVRDPIDVCSNGPVTKDQAVELLNSTLKQHGYAVTRLGRILTVVNLDRAKTADLEIVTGNDPDAVQKSDEMVTQIIPVRYANVSQLVNNLGPLLPASASLSVNESANALVLVSSRTDVQRMLKIISALDSAIARVSSIKVFPLHYAEAAELATVPAGETLLRSSSAHPAVTVSGPPAQHNCPGHRSVRTGPSGPQLGRKS